MIKECIEWDRDRIEVFIRWAVLMNTADEGYNKMQQSVERNKQYIREQIKEQDQQDFFHFFINKPHCEAFQTWNQEQTAQVVKEFYQRKQTPSNLPPVQPNVNSSNQMTSSPQPKHFATSLDILQQIEEAQGIKSARPQHHFNTQTWAPHQRTVEWLNMGQRLPKTPEIRSNSDLFTSFDKLIVRPASSEKAKKEEKASEVKVGLIKQTISEIKIKQKQREFQSKKCITLPSDPTKDRIFKWRTQQRVPCRPVVPQSTIKSLSISGHQMIHRTFLPDYALYHIKVQPKDQVTKRTYDDFQELKKGIQRLYPCWKIPYLEDSSWLAESDIVHINKNKNYLQMFLKGIVDHPVLAHSPLFVTFLSPIDSKSLGKEFERAEKTEPPHSLGDMWSKDGSVGVELSEEVYKIVQKLPKWQQFFENYLEKHSELLATLADQYENLVATHTKLTLLTTEMQQKVRQLSQGGVEIQGQEQLSAYFQSQKGYYERQTFHFKHQTSKLKDVLLPFLKYQKKNIHLFKPTLHALQSLTNQYLARLQHQPQSPSSDNPGYHPSNDRFASVWQQSGNMRVLKYQVGYLQWGVVQETRWFGGRLVEKLREQWERVVKGGE